MLVNVVIDNSINCNPLLNYKSAFLTFPYYDKLINYIKNLRYRYYDANKKSWEIQYQDLISLCKTFPDIQFDIVDNYKEVVENYNLQIPEDYEFNLQPLEYQRDGILYGINHPKFLLGDEMGLGKTLQSIYISDITCKNKVLVIVCSASLKYNWKAEIEKTLGRKDAYVLGTIRKEKKNGTVSEKEGNAQDKLNDLINIDNIKEKFIITNRETITLLNSKKKQGRGYTYNFPIADKINELCKQKKIECILIDECHKGLRNVTGVSSKALEKIHCDRAIAMTGTPIMNTPLDIYVIIKWLGIINNNIDFWTFKSTFANLDDYGNYVSPKNIQQLSNILRSHMLRRLKKEKLPDLPDKMIVEELIEMSPKQKTLYKIINRGLQDELHTMIHSPEPLSKLINLRKVTGCPQVLDASLKEEDNSKLERLKELVKEITDNGHKVVIYSTWTTTTNLIREALSQYNPAYITGEVGNKERMDETNKLQTDSSCKVLIGNSAMGVGLTMTAADYLIFYDEPWTMGDKQQIEDRIHRIGQENKATIINLICKDSIDEGINQLVEKKGAMASYIVDDKIDTSSYKNLLQALLSFGA